MTEEAATEFVSLIRALQSGERPIRNPVELVRKTVPGCWQVGQEQDSSEYLLRLLNSMDGHEKELRKGVPGLTSELFGHSSTQVTTCKGCNNTTENEDFGVGGITLYFGAQVSDKN